MKQLHILLVFLSKTEEMGRKKSTDFYYCNLKAILPVKFAACGGHLIGCEVKSQ